MLRLSVPELGRTLMIPFDRPPRCVTALWGDQAILGVVWETLPETGSVKDVSFEFLFLKNHFWELNLCGGFKTCKCMVIFKDFLFFFRNNAWSLGFFQRKNGPLSNTHGVPHSRAFGHLLLLKPSERQRSSREEVGRWWAVDWKIPDGVFRLYSGFYTSHWLEALVRSHHHDSYCL